MGIADLYASIWQTKATNKNNLRVTQANNDFQERMSRTAHQREVKDLKSAGLNPILTARSAGAPQPSSVAAKVEPYHLPKQDFLAKQMQVQQIKLLQAQSQKTRAEALNTQLQEPYNQALSDLYGSVAGTPVVTANAIGKATGAVASGFGLYKASQVVNRLRKRNTSTVSKSKSVSRKSKFIRSRGGSKSRLQQSKSLRSRSFAPEKDLGKAFNRSYKTFGRFGRFRR